MRSPQLFLLAFALCGCPWVRETALSSAPNLPAPSGCRPGDQRCNGAIPEVCSGSTRWITSLPTAASGSPRSCEGGCVVGPVGGRQVAYCAPVDGGAQ